MWMGYMGKVMKGVEEQPRVVPEGVLQVRINPDTGLRDPNGRTVDYFYQEFLPAEREGDAETPAAAPGSVKPPEEVKSQLF
jgi:penicillin-binding protein 1A